MEQLTQSEKIRLGTKEIAKRIRQQLKEIKGCEFSVNIHEYSGGSSITIALMKANFKVMKDFKDISEHALWDCANRNYTKEQVEDMQKKGYHQLNHYMEDYDADTWNNGVFLTEEGHNLFKRVVGIAWQYNYDNSDSQIDYFDVNFYLHLSIGKWDKPFIAFEV